MRKILLVSSAGGHFSELMKIRREKKYHYVIVTEKNASTNQNQEINYFLKYGTRGKIVSYIFISFFNLIKAFYIIFKEKPNMIISTGAHTCVSFFYIAKLRGIKTIYIESYAKVNTSSLTYRLIKKICDRIIVQHQEMLNIYDNAIYLGGIY